MGDALITLLIFFLLPIAAGIVLSLGLCFFRERFPTPLPWPIFVFLLLLGLAAANIDGVCFGGADILFLHDSSGGFLAGDGFTAVGVGLILSCFAAPGLGVSLRTLQVKDDRSPSAGGAWVWSWLLSQSLLALIVLYLGWGFSFQSFPGGDGIPRDGLPLWSYLIIMGALTVGLGFLFGYRWGRSHGVLAPLLGWLLLSVVTVILLTLMRDRPDCIDPTWGLALIQCTAGSWYALLFTPSAVLLGDFQYRWENTKWTLIASGLAPHVLFTLGYLAPKLCKRGNSNG